MKVQIIGKVTDLCRETALEKFRASERYLRLHGHEVVNPMNLVPEDVPHDEAMRICIAGLLSAEAVAIQPDWIDSRGAKVEVMVAEVLQLKKIYL